MEGERWKGGKEGVREKHHERHMDWFPPTGAPTRAGKSATKAHALDCE